MGLVLGGGGGGAFLLHDFVVPLTGLRVLRMGGGGTGFCTLDDAAKSELPRREKAMRRLASSSACASVIVWRWLGGEEVVEAVVEEPVESFVEESPVKKDWTAIILSSESPEVVWYGTIESCLCECRVKQEAKIIH
jgi:hypothetical protein